MKKSKVIASALMAGVIFIGAGYAAWTDNLKINSTVKTGELNVEFVDKGTLLPIIYPEYIKLEENGGYMKSSVTLENSKTINVKLDNLYPGNGLLYTARFDNKGSIPAVIDRVEVKFNKDNSLLKEKLVVAGGYIQSNSTGSKIKFGAFPNLKDGLKKKYYLKDLEENLNKMLKGTVMQPGDFICMDIPEENKQEIADILNEEGIKGFNPEKDNCVIMGLSATSGNNLKNQSAEFEIRLHFKQHNQQ
ncbi:hypothetical protein [Clostridium polynesiense]|uniref:hypothetical protein n=1 Tax=Clostridium polynesiense TaxID=1325933 RepID=UPI00058EFDC4|nr:hypothetical protein [Clostridium polynesiense]